MKFPRRLGVAFVCSTLILLGACSADDSSPEPTEPTETTEVTADDFATEDQPAVPSINANAEWIDDIELPAEFESIQDPIAVTEGEDTSVTVQGNYPLSFAELEQFLTAQLDEWTIQTNESDEFEGQTFSGLVYVNGDRTFAVSFMAAAAGEPATVVFMHTTGDFGEAEPLEQ